ncbi:hypothetical protein NECAME_11293 [Necator americanus]|uniref:Chondroitin proteoglycan 4 domain-containing protein n=1 Tax=Necator americanus TaxID=51031 RepID=W2T7U4_NECAM|nr:hypothetical protein NECAME_11293 [Necator americanus]ETN77067.1 hypothetical protein NECAME_11293 [Necator americanus]
MKSLTWTVLLISLLGCCFALRPLSRIHWFDVPVVVGASGLPRCAHNCLSDLFMKAAEFITLKDPIDKFKELCTIYNNASSCVAEQEDCFRGSTFEFAFRGIHELCNEREEELEPFGECLERRTEESLQVCDEMCTFTDSLIALSMKENVRRIAHIQSNHELLIWELAPICSSTGCMAACLAEELNAECGEPSGSIIVEALLRPLISTSIILRERVLVLSLPHNSNSPKNVTISPFGHRRRQLFHPRRRGFGKFIRRPSVSIGEAEGIVVIAAGSARGARTGRSAENEQNRLAAQPKHAPAVRQEHQTAPPQEKKQPKKESKKQRPGQQPAPRPGPQPKPAPQRRPVPQPVPQPRPAPQPAPQPRPVPQPAPQPRPVPQPAPRPRPVPQPAPQPRPVPQPAPHPGPQPQPGPQPRPQPQLAPQSRRNVWHSLIQIQRNSPLD